MSRFLPLLPVLFLVGCGDKANYGATPEQALEKMIEAAKADDLALYKSFYSDAALQQLKNSGMVVIQNQDYLPVAWTPKRGMKVLKHDGIEVLRKKELHPGTVRLSVRIPEVNILWFEFVKVGKAGWAFTFSAHGTGFSSPFSGSVSGSVSGSGSGAGGT